MPGYDWFYSNGRNHFWPIMETVYGVKLPTIGDRKKLLTKLQMAISDMILSCERRKKNNADTNLINCVFNTNAILRILSKNKIKTIFFSSRFAESLFCKQFTNLEIKLVTLPSPSPRYAKMTKNEKTARYKELLPGLLP